jgi:hypothetical protein
MTFLEFSVVLSPKSESFTSQRKSSHNDHIVISFERR